MRKFRSWLSLLAVTVTVSAVFVHPAYAAKPSPKITCPQKVTGRMLSIVISSPRPNARFDLAKHPEVTIGGTFQGSLARYARGVELYADGTTIGAATVARRPNRNGSRSWSLTGAVPAGRHTVTACVRTRTGASAAARVTFTMRAPAATETVVAPDVVTPPAKVLNSMSATTADSLTFTRPPGLAAGDVLVAGVTAKTPDGLLRRVTSVGRRGSATVVRTVPAALDEALLQAHIDLTGVPLSGATAQSAGVRAAADILTMKRDLSIKRTDSGVTASGTITTTLKLSMDLHIDIDPDIHWNHVGAKLRTFRWRVYGSAQDDVTAKLSAGGTFDVPGLVPDVRLGAIMISEVPPIVLVPQVGVDFGVRAGVNGSFSFGGTINATVGAGFEWHDGQFTNLNDSSVTGKLDGPLDGKVSGSATATVYVTPHVLASIDGVDGPAVAPEAGLETKLALPCPGETTVSAYAKAKITEQLKIFGKALTSRKVEVTLGEVRQTLLDGLAPGCTGGLGPQDTLPAGQVSHPYSAPLLASGGSAPYTWRITGALPDGLKINGDLLTGTPTRPGDYAIPVAVIDAKGASADGVLHLRIDPDATPLSITSSRLSDGFVGFDYTGGPGGLGGTLPWTWSATGLPDGLTMTGSGSIQGKPTTAGTTNVTVTLTDGIGRTVTAVLPLTVNDFPPPVTTGGDGGGDPVLFVPAAPTCGSYCTTSWGDPHLRTFDGTAYDFQRVGEFTAVRSTVDDLEIQVRQRPWNGSRLVAVNSAVAARIAGHRVGVYLTGTGVRTLVDGAAADPTAGPVTLPGGGTMTLDAGNRRVIVSGPDGTYLAVDYDPGSVLNLTVGLPEAQRDHVQGLLGAVAPDPTTWRVTPQTSLFDYAPGEDTSTYTDTSFPYADLPLTSVPDQNRQAARAACMAAGVTDPALLDACTLDVALSGDRDAAVAAAVAQSATAAPKPEVLAASGAGQPWQDATGATGTSELTYGQLGCTGIDAHNRCTGGTWTTLDDAPWIWTHRLSTPGQYRVTFTATVTVSTARSAVLWAAADDNVTASVNGEQALTAGYNDPESAPISLKPGVNTLSFDVSNNPGDDQQGNPGGLAWKVVAAG